MPTLFQINSFCNTGSTGRIAEELGNIAMSEGWESYIAFGRDANPSKSHIYRIETENGIRWHGVQTRLFDKHGLVSRNATLRLAEHICQVQPDIIHIHNLHGYYLNYPLLFQFLKEYDHPVIWTLHDCWTFTGHCCYFEHAECFKWRTGCYNCPNKRKYPSSFIMDRSKRNFNDKKHWFTLLNNLTIIPVSKWLEGHVRESFLAKYEIKTIHNGIDSDIFMPRDSRQRILHKYNIQANHLVIGVAGVWDERKGLRDFVKLRELLPDDFGIIIVGVNNKQINSLPQNIVGIERTESQKELVEIYAAADVMFNPTIEDNLPTVNLESQSCGTPVVCYKTGGCPETIRNGETGFIIPKEDIEKAIECIKLICKDPKNRYIEKCRKNIVCNFMKKDRYKEYMDVYKDMTKIR